MSVGSNAPGSHVDASISRLWAKSEPFHPLWCHMLDAAAVAFELLPYFGAVEGMSAQWTAALVGLHDVGKADPLFQQKCEPLRAALPADLFAGVLPGDGRRFRHEARSEQIVRELLLRLDEQAGTGSQSVRRAVGRALAGHHGRVNPGADPAAMPSERQYPHRREVWEPLRRALCELVLEACEAGGPPPLRFAHVDRAGVRLLALTIAADWIASNHDLYAPPAERHAPRVYLSEARVRARDAIGLVGLPLAPRAPRASPPWEALWPGLAPRGVQPVVDSVARSLEGRGLVIVEAPTGEGKTEAAIHLAESWMARLALAGFYVALPTQATSDQMHGRVKELLARRHPGAEPLLVHGMAWLTDRVAERPAEWSDMDPGDGAAEQRREADRWLRNSRRALLAPFAVGTVDQVLLSALGVRFGALRLLGLGGKVLIVDEVHACDTFMRRRLKRALSWCRVLGTPVVLLSATLPRPQREELVRAYLGLDEEDDTPAAPVLPPDDGYPLVTVVPESGGPVTCHERPADIAPPPGRTIRLVRHAGLLDDDDGRAELARRVLAAVEPGGCAAVIVNTVTAAQQLFAAVQASAPADVYTVLFHSRFPAWRRQELQREVVARFEKEPRLGRPRRAVVVATQVLEQSLDVDFDVMFTELAPMDLLLQRAGRLHRHARPTRASDAPDCAEPALHVLVPTDGALKFGVSENVYFRLHLLRTLGALADRGTLTLPADFRTLIGAVYEDVAPVGGIPEEILARARAAEQQEVREDERDARHFLIGPPDAGEFRYPELVETFTVAEEDEPELGSGPAQLRAQTRKGDYLTSVFALTRDRDRALAQAVRRSGDRLPRAVLKELLLTRVGVPRKWLPQDGARPSLPEAHGAPMLELYGAGAVVSGIRYDAALGVIREAADED